MAAPRCFGRSLFVAFLVMLLAPSSSIVLASLDEPAAANNASATTNTGLDPECATSCESDDCCANCFECPPSTAAWTVIGDSLFLHRRHPQGYGILFDRTTGDELFNASQLASGTQAGPRLILLHPLSGDRLLDLEYFGIDGWTSTANFGPGLFNLTGDKSQTGPTVTSGSLLYASRLHTAEVNLRNTAYGCIQPLAGFRWVQLGETYQSSGLTDDAGLPLLPYFLHYHTRNDLYGFQLGANGMLWDGGGPLTISCLGKAGIHLNDASNVASYTQTGFAIPNVATRTQQAAFFGELGLTATWHLTEYLALRGGYQLYWLQGVASAPNQVLSTDLVGQTGGINTSGGLFLHGAFAGLQASW